MTSQEYIAKILRAKTETISEMDKKMTQISGKIGVLDKIVAENERQINKTLEILKCRDYRAERVRRALITSLQEDDRALYKLFKRPSGTTMTGLKTLFNFALELANIDQLFVLKKEKAEEILRKNPPPNILKALKYKDIDELLKKEDLAEVFSALRFVETGEWMHKTFDDTYKKLTPQDFEKKDVRLIALSGKWLKVAEKFVKKKYHNVSHLKELGVIFVIPLKIDTPGETLRVFSMILHYLHETKFYSDLFEKYAKEDNFGEKIISMLKGNNPQIESFKDSDMNWLIIQQYLAKNNENEPRLFVPHVNPEAVHWEKTEKDIARLGERFENINLEMWLNVDWIGGFFKNRLKKEELVSFDLIDNWMSLVNRKERIKYLYHHQEALWNHIFEEYMGAENLEKMMIENFDKGIINLK
ncbi:MAG: hypothetical protein Q8N59_03345 [bacterium]|nr:hypothetical protein [bacterium]